MLLFLNGYHCNNKLLQYFRCVKLFIHKISRSYLALQTKYLRLIIVQLCINTFWRHTIKTSKKQHFRFFCRFFSHKIVQISVLKLNILRTAWPILLILVSFRRILKGLSDEINLFWRCSSPLIASRIHFKYWEIILISRLYEQFSQNDSAMAPEKNFKLLKCDHIIYSFEAPHLEISNM